MSAILTPGTPAPGFHSSRGPRQEPLPQRIARQARDPGFLYGGLESGLRRSNGAVQRNSFPSFKNTKPRFWESRWMASGATKRLLKTGILHFPLAGGFRAQGSCRANVRGLSEGGRRLRARPVRHRQETVSSRWSYVSPIAVNPGADGILEGSRPIAKIGGIL